MADCDNEVYYSPAHSLSSLSLNEELIKASQSSNNKSNDHWRSNKYSKAILRHLNKASVGMKKPINLVRCHELPRIKWSTKSILLHFEGCVAIKKPVTVGDHAEETSSNNSTTTAFNDKYSKAILQHLIKANLAIKKLIYMARCHKLPRIKRSKKIFRHTQPLKTMDMKPKTKMD